MLDATDGYWVATLNDVAPDGTSKVLTSGQLVTSLRAYDSAKSEFAPNGDVIDPYLKLTLSSRQPVTPGKAVAVDIGLLPTEALIKAGAFDALHADVVIEGADHLHVAGQGIVPDLHRKALGILRSGEIDLPNRHKQHQKQ